MKLHLPKNLLRAVMALMVAHAATTITWAEDNNQQPVTTTYNITSDVTYGANGSEWIGSTPEWKRNENGEYVLNGGTNTTFTSDADKQYSVTFDGANGAIQDTAIVGSSITVEKLKEIEFTHFNENFIRFQTLKIQDNEKFSVNDNTSQNKYNHNGFIWGQDIIIDYNDEVSISDNHVSTIDGAAYVRDVRGGIIEAASSNAYQGQYSLSISHNKNVNISRNNAISDAARILGGVIFSQGPVILESNEDVSFIGNKAEVRPGDEIILSYHDSISGDIYGGAICVNYHNYTAETSMTGLTIADNTGTVKFHQNSISAVGDASGGAIYTEVFGTVDGEAVFSNNAKLIFTENTAESLSIGVAAGGAIVSLNKLSITGNGDILFDKNTISSVGGLAMGSAIAVENGELIIDNNKGTITVSNNGTTTYSSYYIKDGRHYYGAMAATGAVMSITTTQLTNNTGTITFSGNYIKVIEGTQDNPFNFNKGPADRLVDGEPGVGGLAGGAALVSASGTNISNNKSDIKFSDNTIEAVNRMVFGGALANAMGDAEFIGNAGTVEFTNNTATASGTGSEVHGGAIATLGDIIGMIDPSMGDVDSSVKLKGNGGVLFSGNKASSINAAALGGAIYSSHDVIVSDNKGDVSFIGNGVSGIKADGGAIYAARDLSIVNNDGDVTFQGNYVKDGETYKLNSIYVESGKVELAAADGKAMTFYDTIEVGEGDAIALNSFTNAEGNTQTSGGDIIFSGATTETDLRTAKGGVEGTAAEIAASRTSTIARNVSVTAGSLQVRDQAALSISGSLSVDAGAKLLISGGSAITATDVLISDGAEYSAEAMESAVTYSISEAVSAAQIEGNVTIAAGSTFTMDGTYTELVGDGNTLAISIGEGSIFNLNGATLIDGQNAYFVLFTGVENFTLDGKTITAGSDLLLAIGDYCTYEDAELYYTAHETAGNVVYVKATIPEPTTATLSLLALAALAARRRRK